jgi:hypothetical protein
LSVIMETRANAAKRNAKKSLRFNLPAAFQ